MHDRKGGAKKYCVDCGRKAKWRPCRPRTQTKGPVPKGFAKTTRAIKYSTLWSSSSPDPAGLVENTPPHPQRNVRPFFTGRFFGCNGKSLLPASSIPSTPPPRPLQVTVSHTHYSLGSPHVCINVTHDKVGIAQRSLYAGTIPGDLERRSVSVSEFCQAPYRFQTSNAPLFHSHQPPRSTRPLRRSPRATQTATSRVRTLAQRAISSALACA